VGYSRLSAINETCDSIIMTLENEIVLVREPMFHRECDRRLVWAFGLVTPLLAARSALDIRNGYSFVQKTLE